ncbi:SMAD/FHA domain-containing protein [Ascobolus immersus RN42]|uniref:SMAD/FHA domain-containing protein n=1 Tax=Ascobolus immersus RN42 TaxID=1160509 RepID=A0A3N4I6X4_ASCIM|nr:SMAD/FHA domain-containing protein [Ascobolus immersus RN42]
MFSNSASKPSATFSVLALAPLNGTFEKKVIGVPLYPETLRIGRQTNSKSVPLTTNGFFDSKVLSRQHAEIWCDSTGGVWIRDVKSSNGTFINGRRLSQENKESEPFQIRQEDILELGIDIVAEDGITVIHHKVAAKIEYAGPQSETTKDARRVTFNQQSLPPKNFLRVSPSTKHKISSELLSRKMTVCSCS